MTVEEIFSAVSAHLVEGLMYHDQLHQYYAFLALQGESEAHRGHYESESRAYHKLHDYYLTHYGKLIPRMRSVDPGKIPENWYRYRRDEVDASTKRLAVQTGMESWVDWERETKALYEKSAKDLLDLNEMDAYRFMMCYVEDVSEELKCAEAQKLEYQSTGYDMSYIMDRQSC